MESWFCPFWLYDIMEASFFFHKSTISLTYVLRLLFTIPHFLTQLNLEGRDHAAVSFISPAQSKAAQ